MPFKPKRPCSFPGCPNLTEGRFCPEHQKRENHRYEKYDRNPETKRRYGRAWKRIRDKYVQEHPFCELCFKKGLLVEAEQDPAKANPLEYAIKARKYIAEKTGL